jgi:hypothetical protein
MASANLSFKYKKNKRAVQQISSLTPLTELEKFAKYPPTGPKRCLRGYRTLFVHSWTIACNRPYHTFFSSVLADLRLWIRVLRKEVMAQGVLGRVAPVAIG